MTVDQYIENLPEPQQSIMNQIRQQIKAAFPKAKEALSYGVPAFKYDKAFFYYGAFKAHVSVFPPLTSDEDLQAKTKPYQNDKGNLLFKINQPIPYELIVEVAKALEKQYN
ncbi:iron chaperone [Paracholeplasma manati]|uniref:iron chaperone n=1 Tax=Paracholeplasma manati TaxID=591373 RepID=UPI0024081106|nr:DUF1801 domain-containing protein [Paracholeplasma manati]MDG0889143.1 DUF1801 domain-containing protein [Paracholeplasma manati]